jgi:hypothetical protein
VQPVLNPHAAGADIGAHEIYPENFTEGKVEANRTITQ